MSYLVQVNGGVRCERCKLPAKLDEVDDRLAHDRFCPKRQSPLSSTRHASVGRQDVLPLGFIVPNPDFPVVTEKLAVTVQQAANADYFELSFRSF